MWAAETNFFFLGEEEQTYSFNSRNFPVLARPFFNPNPTVNLGGLAAPGQLSELVALPGLVSGGVEVESRNNFWGIDALARRNLRDGCVWQLDVLGGFRYLHLNDEIRIREMLVGASNPMVMGLVPAGAEQFQGFLGVIEDSFRTQNDFYGGQLGFDSTMYHGRWSLNLRTTVALGNTHSKIQIDGQQVFTQPGTGRTGLNVVPGGLLAIPGANMGTFTRDDFAVVPEVGLNLGYQLTPHVRLYAGYNFLYWNNVLRAGDQISPVVDAARVPTFAPAGSMPLAVVRPVVPFSSTDFWAQGVNFGVQVTW
jgi:hypothetical protein